MADPEPQTPLPEEERAEKLRDEKLETMTKRPIGPLIVRMAIPAIISMMITSFYSLADTWFISHIGENATKAVAAVGVIFSYQAIAQAIGFFFGHGSGNFISRALGQKKRDEASVMASTGAFSAFILGILIAVFAQVAPRPILHLLGATDEIMPEALAYFRFISLATPFFTTHLVFNNQLRLQGNAQRGMVGITSGAILNIFLDALFIFGFRKGIVGASVATAISQVISCCILYAMTRMGDGIPPKWRDFRPTLHNYAEILAGGLPSLSRQGLNAIAAIVLNRYAGSYSADALAGLSIVSRCMFIVISICIGLGQGFQPVCGFNYGARQFDRVREAFWFSVKLGTVAMCIGCIALNIWNSSLIQLFGSSQGAAEIATRTLRYYTTFLPFLAFIVMTEMIHQNTRQTVRASILAMMRQGIALAPSVVIMDAILGLEGVLWAQPVANTIALCVATPMAVQLMNKLKAMSQENNL